jgi:hypothetical protein
MVGTSGETPDREAMIRRKLLESFYGAKVLKEEQAPEGAEDPELKTAALVSTTPEDIVEDDEDFEEDGPREQGSAESLDSPYFDPDAHTKRHVLRSSMHDLLETEELLALQVRTLDSTMQTLVYDNYSSFIDATEAIKSIGVSVNANEEGLARLSRGMKLIDKQTREVEDELGALRDAVAEKVRVKRLLTRLDSLLKLPTTLQQQIGNGSYRLATKSYIQAHSILSKHSVGFESLKTIETDCHDILTVMINTLKHKLLHWSARNSLLMDMDDRVAKEENEDWAPPPEPPKAMSEIFECAGTLFLVLPEDEEDNQRTTFDSGFSADECKSMALSAAVRFLERLLDAHQIELQDAMFSSPSFDDDTYEAKLNRIPMSPELDAPAPPAGSNLIPTDYLDSVLEAATLFGLSFGSGSNSALTKNDRILVADFVSEVYAEFLSHVRSVLLEQSLKAEPAGDDDSANLDDAAATADDDDGDATDGEISGAMTHLLRSVRDLASGLALPEVGVDVQFASGLVDQAVEVTEAMVRRGVAEKFFILRLRVVQDCFGPFLREALALPSDNETRVADIVQMASVALSDGLQLVDDTVRSILTKGGMVSSGKEVQIEMIKEAVQGSSRRFAVWLASALERLGGCESSDSKLLIEGEEKASEAEDEYDDSKLEEDSMPSEVATKADDMSAISDHHESLADKVESRLLEGLAEFDDAPIQVISDLTLAVAEMCRLADRSVMENIQNSISSSMEGDRRAHKSSHLFPLSEGSRAERGHVDKDKDISDRFRLAASRVLALYAMNRGSHAAVNACESLFEMACCDGEEIPPAPRSAVCQLLEIIKLASLDCACVFGGQPRAGVVPDFPEDKIEFAYSSSTVYSRKSPVKGLQLDVERMFSRKVPIYPSPSTILDFDRDAVVTIVMKVAFRAVVEQVRTCTFSASGYRQLQVDVALLRHMIPHYIREDFYADGANACGSIENILDDVMTNAGERCIDFDSIGNERFQDSLSGAMKTPLGIVRQFMTDADAEDDGTLRFIIKVNEAS